MQPAFPTRAWILPVSPNNWKRCRSPRSTPAVTGPECKPNRIESSERWVARCELRNGAGFNTIKADTSGCFNIRRSNRKLWHSPWPTSCVRSERDFQLLRQLIALVHAISCKAHHYQSVIILRFCLMIVKKQRGNKIRLLPFCQPKRGKDEIKSHWFTW